MFKRLKTSMFGRNKVSDRRKNDLLVLAQTEYGRDWQYAYDQLVRTGKLPQEGGVK